MSAETRSPSKTWRLVIAAVTAVALIVAALGVAAIVRDDGSGVSDDVAVEDVAASDADNPFSPSVLIGGVFGGVTGGIEDTIGADLTTWALSAMGIGGGGSSSALKEISQEIVQLNNELKQISSQLAQLECDQTKTALNQYISSISNWYGTYNAYAQDGADGAPPPQAQMQTLVNEMMDPDTGVANALENIRSGALSAAGAEGAISTCISAANGNASTKQFLPTSAALGDTNYYANVVQPIVAYYFNLATMALTLYAEGQHWLGWQAAGGSTGSTSDVIADVCSDTATPTSTTGNAAGVGSAPSFYCVDPQNYQASTANPLVIALFEEGGAPYDSDDVVKANDSNYILARSLEAYTQAAGSDCQYTNGLLPASSAPCGATVGVYDGAFSHIDFASYGSAGGTWVPSAEEPFWYALQGFNALSDTDTTSAAYWLCHQTADTGVTDDDCTGVSGLSNKIVLFPKKDSGSPFGETACFVDGSIGRNDAEQVFCDQNQKAWDALVDTHQYEKCKGADTWPEPSWTQSLASDPAFYHLRANRNGTDDDFASWCDDPDWDHASGYEGYRWPMLDTTALQCTDGRGKTNPGGYPTRCGADFDAWLNSIVVLAPQ